MPAFISTLGPEVKSKSSLGSLGRSRPDLEAGALGAGRPYLVLGTQSLAVALLVLGGAPTHG